MPDLIDNLRQRLLRDEKFRQLLKSNTKKALEEVNIEPSPQNVALVRNVIDSIDNLYAGFDEEDRFVT